jgi:glutamate racemase
VFDSGVGGLSVLKALRAELPFEDFVYVSDSGHAPYGERDEAYVMARAHVVTQYLVAQHQIKALVVACNTATAAAIHLLRAAHPALPIIGVEPALKPALALSKTRRIGVLATRGTLGSAKFQALLASLADQADFVCQPCDGLADAIEHQDAIKIGAAIAQYVSLMGQFGLNYGAIDTVVLGCTHYPFALDALRTALGPQVRFIDNGEPVARQTRRVLPKLNPPNTPGHCQLLCTGHAPALQHAAQHWLQLHSAVVALAV